LTIYKQIIAKLNPVYVIVVSITMFSAIQVVQAQFGFVNEKVSSVVSLLCAVGLIVGTKKICSDTYLESKYFRFVVYIFLSYQLLLIVRGPSLSYNLFKSYLQNDYLLWPSLIPLVVFFNKEDLTFFYFIKSFYYLGIAFLFVCIIDRSLVLQRATAEAFILPFAFTCGFLFLNSKYLPKKVTWTAFISLVIGLLSFIYLARRNAVLSFSLLLLLGIYFWLRNLNAFRFLRLIPIFSLITIAVLVGSDKVPAALTEKFTERLAEDTRSAVFDNYFKGMEEHMVYGKGVNGTYYSPIEAQETDEGVTYSEISNREVIENGYLQMILTGGYINVILFGLVMVPAVFLGIFKSKNHLSRVCGLVILLWLVDMSVYGLPRLQLEYALVWLSAAVCYQTSFRERSDEEILASFEEVGLF
jgi:hypothetical protein